VRSVVLINYFVDFFESGRYVEVLLSYDVTVFEHLSGDISGAYFLHLIISGSCCEIFVIFIHTIASSGSRSIGTIAITSCVESMCTSDITGYVYISIQVSAATYVVVSQTYFSFVSNGCLLH